MRFFKDANWNSRPLFLPLPPLSAACSAEQRHSCEPKAHQTLIHSADRLRPVVPSVRKTDGSGAVQDAAPARLTDRADTGKQSRLRMERRLSRRGRVSVRREVFESIRESRQESDGKAIHAENANLRGPRTRHRFDIKRFARRSGAARARRLLSAPRRTRGVPLRRTPWTEKRGDTAQCRLPRGVPPSLRFQRLCRPFPDAFDELLRKILSGYREGG